MLFCVVCICKNIVNSIFRNYSGQILFSQAEAITRLKKKSFSMCIEQNLSIEENILQTVKMLRIEFL